MFHHKQGTGHSGFYTSNDTLKEDLLLTLELRLEKYTYVQYI